MFSPHTLGLISVISLLVVSSSAPSQQAETAEAVITREVKPAPPLHSRAPDKTNDSYDYWLTGNAVDARPEKTRGGLFLSGGGGRVTDAWKWFVECAGHGDIVVLSASGSDSYQEPLFNTIGGIDSVETINFKSREAASDPHVLETIARADGIFLAGGKQTRYIAWWKDSPVAAAVNAHIRAGKPVGGSSAGLAIMGGYYYGSLNGSVTTKTALGDPFHRMIDLGSKFIQAPALEGVLMDTHFSSRQRLGRLLVFLGRLAVTEKPARVVGVGVDESTALCLEPDGTGRLLTENNGHAWLVEPAGAPEVLQAGKPLIYRHVKVTCIGPESTLHMLERTVSRPVSVRYVTAADGQVNDDP